MHESSSSHLLTLQHSDLIEITKVFVRYEIYRFLKR